MYHKIRYDGTMEEFGVPYFSEDDEDAMSEPVIPKHLPNFPLPVVPKAQGGDYRPHYRKDQVDNYVAYLKADLSLQRNNCIAAEAKVAEQAATISELEEENTSLESALEAATDVKNDKIREQAAIIERLRIERDVLLSVISPADYETIKDRIESLPRSTQQDHSITGPPSKSFPWRRSFCR